MSYIYKVTNLLNGKMYVGKTSRNIAQRWREHVKASRGSSIGKRPLHHAIKKYGPDSFMVEMVEEVEDSRASEREVFWIYSLGTFKTGYNATYGGEGTKILDYDVVIDNYLHTHNMTQTARLLGIHPDTVQIIIKGAGLYVYGQHEVNIDMFGNRVNQFTIDGEWVASYSSVKEAGKAITGNPTHISHACRGKRLTAYGFKWEWA